MEEIVVKPRSVIPYRPKEEYAKVLDFCWEKLQSIPYKPTLRWLFYRVVQELGWSKDDYNKFKNNIMSPARKRYYKEWRPDTLIDDTRNIFKRGHGEYSFNMDLDKVKLQDHYVQIWFEANAMFQQFHYITKDYGVTLVPFSGSYTIYPKWKVAKILEEAKKRWNKPIVVLYFGDWDDKGRKIPKEALKNIKEWSGVDFKVYWCGLTPKQALAHEIPEKLDAKKKGEYQWEALDHKDAEKIITNVLDKFWDKKKTKKIIEQDKKIERDFDVWIQDQIEDVK